VSGYPVGGRDSEASQTQVTNFTGGATFVDGKKMGYANVLRKMLN
jgi:hypothetical protein